MYTYGCRYIFRIHVCIDACICVYVHVCVCVFNNLLFQRHRLKYLRMRWRHLKITWGILVAHGSVSEISQTEKLKNHDFAHMDIKLKATNEWTRTNKNSPATAWRLPEGRGWWSGNGQRGQIYGHGWWFASRRWAHNTMYRWCIVEMYTWNLMSSLTNVTPIHLMKKQTIRSPKIMWEEGM